MSSKSGAIVPSFGAPKAATEKALNDAGLSDDPVLTGGDTGVAYGSCTGSTAKVCELVDAIRGKPHPPLDRADYVRHLSHTAAVNITTYFSLKGRLIPTPSACTA